MNPAIAFFSITAFFLLAFPIESRALLITNVNLIDGTGRSVMQNTSILIRDGRIAGISRSLERGGEEVLDGAGAYALPGLIDSHTHLLSAPGSAHRKDTAETRACLWKYHLHAYLASGVTTILDNAASYGFATQLNRYFEAGGIGPRSFFLAPFLTPPNGYFSDPALRMEAYSDLWSPVTTRGDVVAHLERARELKPVGVKVVIEDGFGPIPVWDVHSARMRKAIREEARRRQMPLFIHSMSNDAHRKALAMKPRVLVHSLFSNETPEPEVIEAMKEAGVFVVSTIGVYDFPQMQWRPSDLDDPLVKLVVPAIEMETARKTLAWEEQNEAIAAANSPGWIPRFLLQAVLGWFYSQDVLKRRLSSAMKDLKRLHDAGVPIVMGSDSGNWPVFVSSFHGPGTIREMELLVEAGIPPLEAIRSATQRAARMIGVGDELGTLEVGRFADLLIVKANPLEDMSALRKIDWVIKEGVAKRPREWMASAPRCP